jgi:hypothetical protein
MIEDERRAWQKLFSLLRAAETPEKMGGEAAWRRALLEADHATYRPQWEHPPALRDLLVPLHARADAVGREAHLRGTSSKTSAADTTPLPGLKELLEAVDAAEAILATL